MQDSTTPTPALGYGDLPRLMTLMTGDEKHSTSATSTLDLIWVLYDRVLRVDPRRPDAPERDRFVLSKGHGPMAYYAVLAAKGFFSIDWLRGFAGYESRLGFHPDARLIPGVEIGSGSLGHGLPIALGIALGLRAGGNRRSRTFCLLGDGEMDEGSNHEAIAVAARTSLGGLTAMVVDNRSASWGWPGGIAARFETEGWDAIAVDGRNHDALAAVLGPRATDRPRAVVAIVEDKY